MLFLFLYFSCKDNQNFPFSQTNSCFFSFPHKNRVGGQAPPHAKPAPHFQKLSFITQSAPPLSGSKAQPPGSGPKVQSLSTLLWGLTPASRLRLIGRSVTRVIRTSTSLRAT